MNNTHFGRTTTISATLVAIMFLGLADIASAQVNDDLANAGSIGALPFVDVLSNVGASLEPSELTASCGVDGGNSVWWSFTPSFSGILIADTDNSDFNTILSVHTGSGHPLTEIACDDDGGLVILRSRVSVPVVNGVTYYFRVTGSSGASGDVELNLQVLPGEDLAGAILVPFLPFTDVLSNVGAGTEPGEADATCQTNGTGSVWWRYTATFSGTLVADTDSSGFDTILSVHTGAGHPLTEIACDDDGGVPTSRSKLSFSATSGVTYYFRIAGFGGAEGDVQFHLQTIPGDDLADAILVPGLPFADTLSNVSAGLESGEATASCSAEVGRSVWWRYTPSFSGVMVANTDSSGFDTILSVHTGSGHPLTEIACDDDSGAPGGRSRLSFVVAKDSTYFIRVTGFNDAMGTVVLSLIPTPDNLNGAVQITSLPFADTLSNVGAGLEAGEQTAFCAGASDGGNSVWWALTPGLPFTLIVDTDTSLFNTILSVHVGNGHPLVELGCDDDGGALPFTSKLTLTVFPGVTYYFRVVGFGGASGDIRFNVKLKLPPNDDLANATPVPGLPFSDTLSSTGTTVEFNEPGTVCGFGIDAWSLWWSFTSTFSGTVVASTDSVHLSEAFFPFVGIYTGSGHPLNEITCDGDGSSLPRASFFVEKDSTYFIRVASLTQQGAFILSVRAASIAFTGKVLLEGAYVSGGLMSVPPAFAAARPTQQPYSDPAYNGSALDYDGLDSVSTFPPNTVDWLLSSLRTSVDDSTEIAVSKQAVLVLNDGSIVGADGDSVRFPVDPGSYYLVLRHRNHLGVMSFSAIDFSSGSGSWDFTTFEKAFIGWGPPTKALGGGLFGMFAGDGNHDGQITASDFNLWLAATKAVQVGYLSADFDLDSQSTASDFNKWLVNTKAVATSQVP